MNNCLIFVLIYRVAQTNLTILHWLLRLQLQQMIQAQQEQSFSEESIPNIEIQKKLYVLHSENERLKSLHEESELHIRNHVRKISELHDKNFQLTSENQRLHEQNQTISKKQQETERKLQLKTEEYASLYNFLFVDRKREFRDLVIQEIEINNSLNMMQHRTDGQVIDNLKENLKSRYQEIRNLSQEISKLNEALLDSSWQYQEKICELKNENIKLSVKVANLEERMKSQNTSVIRKHEQIYEIIEKGKFKAFQEQSQLYRQQIELLRKQIADDKAKLTNLECEKAALIRSLKKNDEDNDIHYDFVEFQQMIKENKALRKEVEETKIKYEYLVRESLYLEQHEDEIHKYILFKDSNKKLKSEKTALEKQIKRLQKDLTENQQRTERLDNRVTQLQLEMDNFRTKSVLTIDKLKKVLAIYVPCFNLYGYSGIGFDDSELKEVEDHKYDKENEIARLSRDIKEKIKNAGNDRKKIDDLEAKVKKQNNTIQASEAEIEELKKKIEKLSVCFRLLKNTKKAEDSYIYDLDSEEEIDEYIVKQSQPFKSEHNNVRITALQEAIQTLQADRLEMIEIIKERDEMLAHQQAKSRLNYQDIPVINIIEPAKITYRPIQIEAPEKFNNSQYIDNSEQLNELKEEVRSLGNKYQKEIELLNIAHQNEFMNLKNKYNKLVAENGELQNLYNRLIQRSEERPIIASEKDNKQASEMVEEAQNVQSFENILQSNDQNTISQYTIQTISDLLKKYQKEFSRFAVLYESKLSSSSVRGAQEYDSNDDEKDRFTEVKRQIAGLQVLLQKNNETIMLMEGELKEKEELLNEQTRIREQECALLQSKIEDLEARLQEAQQVVQDLQIRQLSTLSKEELGEASQESLNTAFVIINSKSLEIDQLKQENESLLKQLSEKEQQFRRLSDSVFKTDSPLAQKELELLRKVIQQENLPGILQSYLTYLEKSSSNEMEEQED